MVLDAQTNAGVIGIGFAGVFASGEGEPSPVATGGGAPWLLTARRRCIRVLPWLLLVKGL